MSIGLTSTAFADPWIYPHPATSLSSFVKLFRSFILFLSLRVRAGSALILADTEWRFDSLSVEDRDDVGGRSRGPG